MTDWRVSVIVPAFNSSETLPRALAGLALQSVAPAEVLVVDDGSADDIAAAVRGFSSVTLVRKSNGGAGSARNVGIDLASGNLIAFLDADDYWEPHKLEQQLVVFAQHPSVGFVMSAYFELKPGGERSRSVGMPRGRADTPQRTRRGALVDLVRATWTSSVVIRREVLGSDRFAVDLRTGEDRDLWLRLLPRTTSYFVSEPLATAVLEEGSLSRSDPDGDYSNMLQVISRNSATLGSLASWRWRRLVLKAWAAAHLGVHQASKALGPAARRLALEPWSPEAWWILAKGLWLSRRYRRPGGGEGAAS